MPPQDIEVPLPLLKSCTTQEHCRSLLAAGSLPFWWYQDLIDSGRHFSLPFQDSLGSWWYQVRRGYAWPVDAIDELPASGRSLPYAKSFLASQHVVPPGEASNSTLVINTITDLAAYSTGSIDDKRRNAIRKGAKSCEVISLQEVDDNLLPGIVQAWNDLVARTGWKSQRDARAIRDSWKQLLHLPAASILVAVERAGGQVAGFLITKIHGTTAYVDTIASNSNLLKNNPNDILMYTFIRAAQKLPGVTQVHYAIKSSVTALEDFKTSLGFAPHPFPAMLKARPGMMTLLRTFKPALYKRLMGQLE